MPFQAHFGPFFVMGQSSQAFSSRSQAPSECFYEPLPRALYDITLHSYLALVALKRKSTPMDKQARRAPSIVGWFCRRPSPESVDGSVAPPACLCALVAA